MVTAKRRAKQQRTQGASAGSTPGVPARPGYRGDVVRQLLGVADAFGGLLAPMKFLDLIKFEQAYAQHYMPPRRALNLGAYRMRWGSYCSCSLGSSSWVTCLHLGRTDDLRAVAVDGTAVGTRPPMTTGTSTSLRAGPRRVG